MGITINLVVGLGLPTDATEKANDHVYWRIIIALPLVFIAAQLILWIFVFKLDSVKHSFSVKDFDSCRAHLRKIYRTNDEQRSESIFDEHHEIHDKAEKEQGYKPGYISVLCDSKFALGTWFAIALAFFNQGSGVNCITIYSSDLFDDLHISPTIGSAMVGVFQLIGCLLAT